MPGMAGMPGMADALKDPEVQRLLQDPEVMQILTDANLRNQVMACMQNPQAFANNPRVTKLAQKVGPLFAKFAQGAPQGGQETKPTGGPSFDDDVD